MNQPEYQNLQVEKQIHSAEEIFGKMAKQSEFKVPSKNMSKPSVA
jgi:hypothetical protein